MAFNITRGKQDKAVKSIIYGQAGIGKSTFAAAFPDPLFIDTEDSTVNMDVARFDKPTDWQTLLAQVKEVKNNPSLCRTLVIDTADWAERLCEKFICERGSSTGGKSVNSIEDFGYGKGYVLAKEEFGRLLDLLSEVTEKGVHVVLTAHSVIRRFELPDEAGSYDRYELKLGGKSGNACAALAKEWSDLLLFANYKTAVTEINGKKKAQGGRRVMYTQYNPCWDAKNRFGLKEMLPFDFKEIAPYIVKNKPTPTQGQKSPIEPPPKNFIAERDMYFVHRQDEKMLFKLAKGEEIDGAEYESDKGNWREITAEEYRRLERLAKTAAEVEKKNKDMENFRREKTAERLGIDSRLADLCNTDGINIEDLGTILKNMGQMPSDAKLGEAPKEFVDDVILHWQEVKSELERLPF